MVKNQQVQGQFPLLSLAKTMKMLLPNLPVLAFFDSWYQP